MNANSSAPLLWTTWLDYSATGEGRTLMTRITHAYGPDDARRKFEERFGAYFARGCDAACGIVRNEVVGYLVSEEALNFAQQCNGTLDIVASLHVNFS
jgi:hypothetical protein